MFAVQWAAKVDKAFLCYYNINAHIHKIYILIPVNF